MIETLGDLGDFIGGIAVVATLIYLAIQVRQNTAQLDRSSTLTTLQAHDTTFESFSRFRAQLSASADLADLYVKGLRDRDSLSGSERFRFDLLVQELFYILQSSFFRIRVASGETEEFAFRALDVESLVRSPGIVQWWRSNKRAFRPEFAEMIEAHLAKTARED